MLPGWYDHGPCVGFGIRQEDIATMIDWEDVQPGSERREESITIAVGLVRSCRVVQAFRRLSVAVVEE